MSRWDQLELLFVSVLLLALMFVNFPRGAVFFRYLFNLSVTVFLGLLYALPLVAIALRPALTDSTWFIICALLFIKAVLVLSVMFITKRNRLYFWVIRKLR